MILTTSFVCEHEDLNGVGDDGDFSAMDMFKL
jgi:hypothetical protein